MNADSVALIIDNTREWADDAYTCAVRIMRNAGMLPGMANDGEATQPVARAIGTSIRGMIATRALRETGIAEGHTTMTARLFFTALDHINWEYVGDHYYIVAEERYAADTGQRI